MYPMWPWALEISYNASARLQVHRPTAAGATILRNWRFSFFKKFSWSYLQAVPICVANADFWRCSCRWRRCGVPADIEGLLIMTDPKVQRVSLNTACSRCCFSRFVRCPRDTAQSLRYSSQTDRVSERSTEFSLGWLTKWEFDESAPLYFFFGNDPKLFS